MSGFIRSPVRMLAAAIAILAVTAGALALSAYFGKSAAGGRSGQLHATKDCAKYTGLAGSSCIFTSSNLSEIKVGSLMVYLQAKGKSLLESDVVLVVGQGNYATGHCHLPLPERPGQCIFTGGAGTL